MPDSDLQPAPVTAAQLARMWKVSRQNIGQLAKKGIIPRREDGLYDEPAALRAYLRNSDPAFRRAPALTGLTAAPSQAGFQDDPDFIQARAMRAEYESKLKQLEFQVKSGDLVDGKVVALRWFNTLRMVRDRVLQVPDRFAPTLVGERDPAVIKDTLEREFRRILDDASAEMDKTFRSDPPQPADSSACTQSRSTIPPLYNPCFNKEEECMSPTQDPLLTAIDAYQKSLAAIDAEPDAPGEKGAQNAIAYNSNMKALESWATPAKSRAGAIEALRLAKEEAGVFFDDPLIFSMIGAALSYLEHHDA